MRKIFKCILYTLLLSFPIYFLSLILFTPLKVSDLTSDRISLLANRPANLKKDIVVDLTKCGDNGGIATYASEVIKYLVKNRPNYRWIIIYQGAYGNAEFRKFLEEQSKKNNNLLLINATSKFGEAIKLFYFVEKSKIFKSLDEKFSKWLSSQSEEFNDRFYRIKQIFLHGTLFVDRHCDLIFSLATPSYSFGYGIPQVSVIHDVIHLDKPEIVSFSSYLNHVRAFSNNFNCSTKLISISNFTKGCILKYFDDIHDEKIHVIRTQMAARLPNISNDKKLDILKQFNIQEGKYFVFASRFWSHKNHTRLAEAFAKMLQKYQINNDLKLVFMGDYKSSKGKPFKTAKKAINVIEHNNITNRVVFTGYTTNEEFNAIMSGSLAVVNPSLYEGFGMPVAEAMLLEKPVVCSNAASIPEIGGDAALYFDPLDSNDIAEKLYQIYSNSKLRHDMIERGNKQVQNFTDQNKMLNDVIQLIDNTIKQTPDNKYKIDWDFCSVK